MLTQATPLPSQTTPPNRGELFDSVARVLQTAYYDSAYRADVLPRIAAEMRPAAAAAATAEQERAVVREFLGRIPASHLALISSHGRQMLEDELFGRPAATLGLQLVHWGDRYYAALVLVGGPAEAAGVRSWEEIVAIDGVAPERSARLDWSTDDAHLPDDRDPPMHALLVAAGERVRLTVAARPGAARVVDVTARPYSALEAARASVRTVDRAGVRIGYVHLWYLHMNGVPELLGNAFDGPLAGIQALVLDLRGRGGSAPVVPRVLRLISPGPEQRFAGPVIALIDRQSRSGKEVLAYELREQRIGRLVGEPTAGAVIPAAFAQVAPDAVLMFPPMTLPTYSARQELRPTPPDVFVEWGGPYSGSGDPILEAGLDAAARAATSTGFGRVLARNTPREPDADTPLPPAPTFAELIARMAAAVGGEPLPAGGGELRAEGRARIVDTPVEGTYRMELHRDGTFRSEMQLSGIISVAQEVDAGGGTWVAGAAPGSRVPVRGADASPLRWAALRGGPRQISDAFPGAHVEGVERFRLRPCVRLRLGSDPASAVLYVDAGSWLASGMTFETRTGLGPLTATVSYDDYRPVDGVRIPHRIVTEAAGQQTEVVLTSVVRR